MTKRTGNNTPEVTRTHTYCNTPTPQTSEFTTKNGAEDQIERLKMVAGGWMQGRLLRWWSRFGDSTSHMTKYVVRLSSYQKPASPNKYAGKAKWPATIARVR